MKKLLILLVVFALPAMGVKVFAQSSGNAPAPGATHKYSVTPGNSENTITWKVTKYNLDDDAGPDALISDAGTAAVNISWADNLTVGDWYFVHVVESDGACSNEKVLPVQITASPFFLEITAENNACYDNAVEVSLVSSATVNYVHGTATLEFTVTPTGLSDSYSGYSFDINLDFGAYTGLNVADASVSSNAVISEGTVTVNDNAAVKITYVINNENVFTNADAANAQNFTVKATISNGEASNGVDDNGSGSDSGVTDVARPNTSGINTN